MSSCTSATVSVDELQTVFITTIDDSKLAAVESDSSWTDAGNTSVRDERDRAVEELFGPTLRLTAAGRD